MSAKPVFLLSSYRYDLPPEQIAQIPVHPPESAKLLVASGIPKSFQVFHSTFSELPDLIQSGSLVFFNDTRVLPARIKTNARILRLNGKDDVRPIEFLYLSQLESTEGSNYIEAMVYPWDSFPVWARVWIGEFELVVREITYQGRTFEFVGIPSQTEIPNEVGTPSQKQVASPNQTGTVFDMLEKYGTYPIPPYIEPSEAAQDQYQTVFAKHDGSLAAPTASLHFTQDLIAEMRARGIQIQYATLHVGLGTFKIVNDPDIRDHVMHPEPASVDATIFEKIHETKLSGKPIVAVGTTMVRYLESLVYLWPKVSEELNLSEWARTRWNNLSDEAIRTNGQEFLSRPDTVESRSVESGTVSFQTWLFIYPGYRFSIVDEIVTNFHLPESTLMAMISAFVGLESLLEWYEVARDNGYRFYSFGDGMYVRKQIFSTNQS